MFINTCALGEVSDKLFRMLMCSLDINNIEILRSYMYNLTNHAASETMLL